MFGGEKIRPSKKKLRTDKKNRTERQKNIRPEKKTGYTKKSIQRKIAFSPVSNKISFPLKKKKIIFKLFLCTKLELKQIFLQHIF